MKQLTVLFTLFLVLIVVLADTGNLGVLAVVYTIPYADKLGHFLLYGILALLVNLTLFRAFAGQSRRLLSVTITLTLFLVIGLEELSQRSFVSRTFSLEDLAASYLGVILFSWLAIKTKNGVNIS